MRERERERKYSVYVTACSAGTETGKKDEEKKYCQEHLQSMCRLFTSTGCTVFLYVNLWKAEMQKELTLQNSCRFSKRNANSERVIIPHQEGTLYSQLLSCSMSWKKGLDDNGTIEPGERGNYI
ncbi:hypothetical protein TNCV_4193961 [Trichonephila clavipes]|nr:hypothetical protein TNCV_4193961 [Trichonephila clavipes]